MSETIPEYSAEATEAKDALKKTMDFLPLHYMLLINSLTLCNDYIHVIKENKDPLYIDDEKEKKDYREKSILYPAEIKAYVSDIDSIILKYTENIKKIVGADTIEFSETNHNFNPKTPDQAQLEKIESSISEDETKELLQKMSTCDVIYEKIENTMTQIEKSACESTVITNETTMQYVYAFFEHFYAVGEEIKILQKKTLV